VGKSACDEVRVSACLTELLRWTLRSRAALDAWAATGVSGGAFCRTSPASLVGGTETVITGFVWRGVVRPEPLSEDGRPEARFPVERDLTGDGVFLDLEPEVTGRTELVTEPEDGDETFAGGKVVMNEEDSGSGVWMLGRES
jgi:hypothetical protein